MYPSVGTAGRVQPVQGRCHWGEQGPVASVLGRKTLAGSPGKRLPEME